MALHFEVSSLALLGSTKALYLLPHDEARILTVKSNALLKPVLKVFQGDRHYAAAIICTGTHTHIIRAMKGCLLEQ
jgi:hypothetical protein